MIPLSKLEVSMAKGKQFQKKGITCVEELASFFPRKYQDYREKKAVKDLRDGDICRVSGVITRIYDNDRFVITLDDGTGDIAITWFGGCYYKKALIPGSPWTFCGKVSYFRGQPQIVQPTMSAPGENQLAHIHPFYSKIQGMSDKYLTEKIDASLSVMAAGSVWSEQDAVAKAMGLMDKIPAYREMHHPTGSDSWKKAKRRISFDQIYDFYETLYSRRQNKSFALAKPMPKRDKMDGFIKTLPFPLTGDQEKAVESIYSGTNGDATLNAMVSGDVGCGKTAVALISAFLAWENGYQTIIMAPTLVLAKQHYDEMTKMVSAIGVKFALLTGEVKAKERKEILKGLEDGSIDILIGTHAVLSPDLSFKNLGLTIVDEEHRFGAQQKELLEAFDKAGTHHLSMTATPIPRSYASSIYGDSLDLITIEEMPKGRKPVITSVEHDREEVYRKLLTEINAGHQAYVICPFIEDSEDEKFKDILSVKAVTDELKTFCKSIGTGIKVECISGDMKQQDVLEIIDRFAASEIQILVSTTIVEVGVNVPNATAIVVMNAERFGLSAMHQLRGRVGRKGDQGYCYLVSDVSNEKLAAMTMYSSGFKIAEMDLKLRGPGDILGSEQTGDSKVVEVILRYPNLAASIRKYFQNKK